MVWELDASEKGKSKGVGQGWEARKRSFLLAPGPHPPLPSSSRSRFLCACFARDLERLCPVYESSLNNYSWKAKFFLGFFDNIRHMDRNSECKPAFMSKTDVSDRIIMGCSRQLVQSVRWKERTKHHHKNCITLEKKRYFTAEWGVFNPRFGKTLFIEEFYTGFWRLEVIKLAEIEEPAEMPRGESGSSPRKRAAATDLHERLGKDELIKRLKVSEDNLRNDRNAW